MGKHSKHKRRSSHGEEYKLNKSIEHEAIRLIFLVIPTAAFLLAVSQIGDLQEATEATNIALITTYTASELILFIVSCRLRFVEAKRCRGMLARILVVGGFIAWHLDLQLGRRAFGVQLALACTSVVLLSFFSWVAHRELRLVQLAASAAATEANEIRVQYDALRKLVRRRLDFDDSESESEDDGDDREHQIVPPAPVTLSKEAIGQPDLAFAEALHGLTFDRDLALKIAGHIRKRGYTLGHFYADIQKAFPELQLYLVRGPADEAEEWLDENTHVSVENSAAMDGRPPITSGLHPDDEYRRTIGALFAVYWLMRIGIDGERGFSFGVDENWIPHMPPDFDDPNGDEMRIMEVRERRPSLSMPDARHGWEKRKAFYQNQDWDRLQQLLIDAGMLEKRQMNASSPFAPHLQHRRLSETSLAMSGEKGFYVTVNVERTMAMLALTAFHDIMKIEALLPKVKREHAPYLGFKEGDTINDHDTALAYVLDFYSDQLPSFTQLNDVDMRTVRFTQSKMQFNHGWLVQGEAPPASLFCKFKQVLLADGVSPTDVSFYFVHWLTDLAGAEPSPLGGGEKFVLKFPHAVLDSFIRSFGVIHELAIHPETKVMEEYLVRTWRQLDLGPEPTDHDGIALMRLALQAQLPEKQKAVIEAFQNLPDIDKEVLRCEMARTGIYGQAFQRGPEFQAYMGPTFLVYYSPAFVRMLCPHQAKEALIMLAEVYRRARRLWPLRPTNSNDHAVTVRIDQIKELRLNQIRDVLAEGSTWVLCRKNDLEGVVEKHAIENVPDVMKSQPVAVLKFWRNTTNIEEENSHPSSGQSSARSHLSGHSHHSNVHGGGGTTTSNKERRMSATRQVKFTAAKHYNYKNKRNSSHSGLPGPVGQLMDQLTSPWTRHTRRDDDDESRRRSMAGARSDSPPNCQQV